MPSRVMLTAVRGPLTGTKYRFDEQMICMVGRSTSCMLQLVEDAGKGVSRHHCLLDIRPERDVCERGEASAGLRRQSVGDAVPDDRRRDRDRLERF